MALNNMLQTAITTAVNNIKKYILQQIEEHIDESLNNTSTNAIQNKVVYEEINDIADAIVWILENTEDITEIKERLTTLENKSTITQEDIDERIESYLEEITTKLGEQKT